MEFEFGSRDLEARYHSIREAKRACGKDVAEAYQRKLLFLAGAEDEAAVRAARGLRLHALRGDLGGRSAIVLVGRWRLIVVITGNTVRIEEVSNHYGD